MADVIILDPARFNSDLVGGTRRYIRTAFFDQGYGVSERFSGYARGAGIVPNTAPFSTIGLGTVGSPLRMSQFNGFTVPSLVTFSPEGGASVGTAVYLISDEPYGQAVLEVACTQNAVWTYTKTFDSGNGNEFVSLSSGSTATSITFTLDSLPGWDFQLSRRVWNLSATSGGITQYWQINLRSDYT
jgi:hypothetical protein